MHAEAKRKEGACVTPTMEGKWRPGDTATGRRLGWEFQPHARLTSQSQVVLSGNGNASRESRNIYVPRYPLRCRIQIPNSPRPLHAHSNVLPRPPTPAPSTDKLRRLETPSGERRTSSCDVEPHVHRPDPTIGKLHLEIAPVRCNCTVYVNRRRAAPR